MHEDMYGLIWSKSCQQYFTVNQPLSMHSLIGLFPRVLTPWLNIKNVQIRKYKIWQNKRDGRGNINKTTEFYPIAEFMYEERKSCTHTVTSWNAWTGIWGLPTAHGNRELKLNQGDILIALNLYPDLDQFQHLEMYKQDSLWGFCYFSSLGIWCMTV